MTNEYPSLIRRYLGSFLDFIVAFSIAILVAKIVGNSEYLEARTSVIVFFLPFIMYEPIMTATSATLGQLVFGFRVRKMDEKTKINVGFAFLRLLIKYLLGIISLLTIPGRKDRRAIHDLVTASIVVSKTSD